MSVIRVGAPSAEGVGSLVEPTDRFECDAEEVARVGVGCVARDGGVEEGHGLVIAVGFVEQLAERDSRVEVCGVVGDDHPRGLLGGGIIAALALNARGDQQRRGVARGEGKRFAE
ncbi:MAG: hypothetical protein ABIS25_08930 [Sphingomicrobium sp.]